VLEKSGTLVLLDMILKRLDILSGLLIKRETYAVLRRRNRT